MNEPLISIILPTRNRLKTIRDTISHILSQTVTDWELVISDNASDEPGKLTYLDQLAASDPRIKIHLQKQNVGIHDNWVFSIKQCRGRYYIASTDDDRWEGTDFLEKLLAMHDGSTAVVFPNLSIEYSETGKLDRNLLSDVYSNSMTSAELCLQMVTHKQGVLMMGLFDLSVIHKEVICRVYDHKRNGNCETVGMVMIARDYPVKFQKDANYLHINYGGNYLRGCDKEEVLRDSALGNFLLLEELRIAALTNSTFLPALAAQWKNCVEDSKSITKRCLIQEGRVLYHPPRQKSRIRKFLSLKRKAIKRLFLGQS